MGTSRHTRTTQQKLAIFQALFTGLQDVYGTYDPETGRAWQVKQPVTREVLLHHLQGKRPYGVYLLVGDRTRAVAVDFDEDDTSPPMAFLQRVRHYGMEAYLERSKSKGWHAGVFAALPGVPAAKARAVINAILRDIGRPATEVFPKQDRLDGSTRWGNYIYAPLFGAMVAKGRTVFVDPENGLRPFPNQWDFLESIQRVPEAQLDRIVERCGLPKPHEAASAPGPRPASSAARPAFGLPPCAQRMLAEGVGKFQRVACFRLAAHLRKAGMPEDVALAALMAWAAKNRPINGNGVITRAEVHEQTQCAYAKDYRGCGCEEPVVVPYCDPSCLLRRSSPASANQRPHPPVAAAAPKPPQP